MSGGWYDRDRKFHHVVVSLIIRCTCVSGMFVMEYVGEVLDQRDFKKRVKEYAYDKQRHYYFMALRADEIIDATQKGNFSRFINHSCDPNCETQKVSCLGTRYLTICFVFSFQLRFLFSVKTKYA